MVNTDDKQILERIIKNAEINEVTAYSDREVYEIVKLVTLSEEDFNWIVNKLKEKL